jgi:hypothetical protein
MLSIRIQLATVGQVTIALVIRDGRDLPVQIEISVP